MSNFPLYPELSEQGKKEAEIVIERFKKRMKDIAEETLGEVYVDIADHIESDSWVNFRNSLLDGFKGYGNRNIQGRYDFKLIREQIYFQFRDELIKDLDQDNLERIKNLESDVARLQEMLSSRYR